MKIKNINFFLIIIILIIIYFIFKRQININLMFLIYDIYALFGLYWQTTPEYCSPMKFGFTPVMPLEFYAEFNKAVFDRIPSGDNTLNSEEVIRICDRNLEWLIKNGEIYDKPKKIEVLYIDQQDFKEKVLYYVKND
jgi:hypothetical protein